MEKISMVGETARTTLRLSPELMKLIEKRANDHLRSINYEIIAMLKIALACDLDEAEAFEKADQIIAGFASSDEK